MADKFLDLRCEKKLDKGYSVAEIAEALEEKVRDIERIVTELKTE